MVRIAEDEFAPPPNCQRKSPCLGEPTFEGAHFGLCEYLIAIRAIRLDGGARLFQESIPFLPELIRRLRWLRGKFAPGIKRVFWLVEGFIRERFGPAL